MHRSTGRMSRAAGAGQAMSGYTHLGAGTGGTWTGVNGRLSVVDGGVRGWTYDFIANRFMVKRGQGNGNIAWLEAGWAETGWAGQGRQHIYTFNTNTMQWQFYDQYQIRPGDKPWIDIHTDGNDIWQAWLWWNNRWNLLTAQKLPLGAGAYVEQYLEVYADPRKPARVSVPEVRTNYVQLYGSDPDLVPWDEDVPTVTGSNPPKDGSGLCLEWVALWNTWKAGNC
ncbi:hypothetical protein [Actinoplanes sp. NPDC051494]|uniref:hypothetical protein n=1 Tax=Actinoplanes sp. NPDC051494 TaxID=3363907 RepID=UPI0037A9F9C3